MTDFLIRLAERALGIAAVAQPRVPSVFAPAAEGISEWPAPESIESSPAPETAVLPSSPERVSSSSVHDRALHTRHLDPARHLVRPGQSDVDVRRAGQVAGPEAETVPTRPDPPGWILESGPPAARSDRQDTRDSSEQFRFRPPRRVPAPRAWLPEPPASMGSLHQDPIGSAPSLEGNPPNAGRSGRPMTRVEDVAATTTDQRLGSELRVGGPQERSALSKSRRSGQPDRRLPQIEPPIRAPLRPTLHAPLRHGAETPVRPEAVPQTRPRKRIQAERTGTLPRSATLPSSPPTIRVTIGRIEVRAISATPDAPRPASPRPGPALSLDEYLKQRGGNER